MSLRPRTRLGNYEIISELGSGGMGEVYKANDLKLGREVAIKVLPAEMVSDSTRLERFEQEARAASALNHPNIVTIYEIDDHEGTPYIAMEYVEGATLRELVAGGPLANDELIRWTMQIAEGLAKAHQAGIIHRDLKPENVMISADGYAKILDFGLAKLLPKGGVSPEASTMARNTVPGAIVGTVGYMSPEQARGEPADSLSDQFSFGAIAYEMATGRRAFEATTAAETLTAILREQPQPVASLNPKVPGHMASVIDRCLSKASNERFETTWDIAREIRREERLIHEQPAERRPLAGVWAVGALAVILVMMLALFVPEVRDWVTGKSDGATIESIAVLPLENISGDAEQEYFADGITDALIGDLAKISACE